MKLTGTFPIQSSDWILDSVDFNSHTNPCSPTKLKPALLSSRGVVEFNVSRIGSRSYQQS